MFILIILPLALVIGMVAALVVSIKNKNEYSGYGG
jgi:hypothetical protein